MKKLLVILLSVMVVLVLIVVLLPKISTKENCSYEDVIEKYSKGKFIDVDGKKVHYIEKGNGKPIILIHGFLYHTVMWDKSIDALAENFKVYAIDLWGWGYSERLESLDYSFELYGKQVTGFMDALNIQKAALVGQSMGGGISVYVAAHYPERVDKLILVSPAVIPYPMTAIGKFYQLPFVGEFLNAIPGEALLRNNIETLWFYDKNKVSEEYFQEVVRPFCIKGTRAGMMYILRNVLKDPYVEPEANLLAKTTMSILIVHGMEDKAVPVDRSKVLNNLWGESKLEIFQKAGHTAHEEYPEKFNTLAKKFLSQ